LLLSLLAIFMVLGGWCWGASLVVDGLFFFLFEEPGFLFFSDVAVCMTLRLKFYFADLALCFIF